MSLKLHLIAEVGTWTEPGATTEPLTRLESYLDAHPQIAVTLVTRGSLQQALTKLGAIGRIMPDHFISDAGTALFHRIEANEWKEDADYRAWAEALWDPRALERLVEWGEPKGARRAIGGYSSRHVTFEFEPQADPSLAIEKLETTLVHFGLNGAVERFGQALEVVPKGVSRVAAASFLHKQLPDPGPLVVCGSTELNLGLFQHADFPVLMANSPMDFQTPGIPSERLYLAAGTGPAGILEALLRFEYDNRYAMNQEKA